jgi:hypothetical protein
VIPTLAKKEPSNVCSKVRDRWPSLPSKPQKIISVKDPKREKIISFYVWMALECRLLVGLVSGLEDQQILLSYVKEEVK